MDTPVIAAWYESEGLRLALAAISGGMGTTVINNIFRWRSENVDVEGKKIDADTKASSQWKELFRVQTDRLEAAEKSCSEKIAALESRVHDLEAQVHKYHSTAG